MFDESRCESRFGPLIAERRAGALSRKDAAALERHLRSCERCRTWEEEMREIVESVRRAASEGILDHPAPEALAALSDGGASLSPGERTEIESHLAACADCRAEWNVATRWSPVRAPAASAPPTPGRWPWFAAGALSAAAAAVVFALVLRPVAPPSMSPRDALEIAAAPVQIRGAHHRASAEATPVPVRPGTEAVVVALTVEARPGSRLQIEIRDEADRSLAAVDRTLDDPSGLVLLSVAVARLPERDGEFRVRVDGAPEVLRYPFRVERSGG